MATAFQKVYTKISQITKATCSLKAKGVGYNELATINGKLAQVVKIIGLLSTGYEQDSCRSYQYQFLKSFHHSFMFYLATKVQIIAEINE